MSPQQTPREFARVAAAFEIKEASAPWGERGQSVSGPRRINDGVALRFRFPQNEEAANLSSAVIAAAIPVATAT